VSNIVVPGSLKRKVKVLVGIPMYDSMKAKSLACYTDFLVREAHSPRISCHAMYHGGTYLDVNREEIAQTAINENYDYLFFVDSDMIFKSDVLERLYDRNKGIIGAIYSIRGGKEHGPCIYNYSKKQDTYVIFKHWPLNDGVIKVDGIGTGLLLIKISELKKIPAPRFAYLECETPDSGGNRRRLGEDLSFCHRCMDNNIKIYADTTIWTGHLGEHVFTYRDFQMSQIIKKNPEFKNLGVLTVG